MFNPISFRPACALNKTKFGCENCQSNPWNPTKEEKATQDFFDRVLPSNTAERPIKKDHFEIEDDEFSCKEPISSGTDENGHSKSDYAEKYEPTLSLEKASKQADLVQNVFDSKDRLNAFEAEA